MWVYFKLHIYIHLELPQCKNTVCFFSRAFTSTNLKFFTTVSSIENIYLTSRGKVIIEGCEHGSRDKIGYMQLQISNKQGTYIL